MKIKFLKAYQLFCPGDRVDLHENLAGPLIDRKVAEADDPAPVKPAKRSKKNEP